jgi:hypothetical protein
MLVKWTSLALLMITILSACGSRKSVDPFPKSTLINASEARESRPTLRAPRSYTNPLKSLSYEYSNERCTTGKKKFRTEYELCMNLLEESVNQNCESTTRFEIFRRFCTLPPLNLIPYDGIECRFGALKPEHLNTDLLTDQSCQNQFKDEDFTEVMRACIGHAIDAQDTAHGPRSYFYLGLALNLNYTPVNLETNESFTQFQLGEMLFSRRGKNGIHGCQSQLASSQSRPVRMYASCKPVNGCKTSLNKEFDR